jgi:hypothetical protein
MKASGSDKLAAQKRDIRHIEQTMKKYNFGIYLNDFIDDNLCLVIDDAPNHGCFENIDDLSYPDLSYLPDRVIDDLVRGKFTIRLRNRNGRLIFAIMNGKKYIDELPSRPNLKKLKTMCRHYVEWWHEMGFVFLDDDNNALQRRL